MLSLALASVLAAAPDAELARILDGAEEFSPAQFTRAMKAIEALGPAAAAPLGKQLLTSKGENTRWTICEALSRFPGPEALPAIESQLGSKSDLVRSACTRAFGACLVKGGRTPERMSRIRALVDSPDCGVRQSAAEAIGPLDDPLLHARFVTLLRTPGCDRLVALTGLASTKTDTARIGASILAILQDANEEPGTRAAAAVALGRLRHLPARDSLRALLVGPDPGMNLRSFAIDALGEIGTRDDIPLLKKVIASDPYHGEGVWAVSGREAIARIERRERR